LGKATPGLPGTPQLTGHSAVTSRHAEIFIGPAKLRFSPLDESTRGDPAPGFAFSERERPRRREDLNLNPAV
jgi:hypothetical protein